MNKRRILIGHLAALLVLSNGACHAAAEPTAEPTTVLFVRHAEKMSGDDPSLTGEGRERARELARVVADVGIEAIYSTQFVRTRETARPLAESLEIKVTINEVRGGDLKGYAERFARRLLDEHRGQTVAVVGHSNTVPILIEALGVHGPPSLTEKDYDDLFVVTVDATTGATLLHLHYGEPSP